jgi:hypothetical protein
MIEMWDCATRQVLWSVPTEAGGVGKFDGFFSADGSRFLVTDRPDRGLGVRQATQTAPVVTVRDTRSGQPYPEFRLQTGSQIHGLSISPDGRRVVSVAAGGQSRSLVFNTDTGRELVANFDADAPPQAVGRVAQRVLLTPDGQLIAAQKAADGNVASLLAWDGRATAQPAKPSATIDDWLAEAFRLTEDPDPAKRNPSRALELTARARDMYPEVEACDLPYGLALLRAKRFAEAADVLLACVIREEAVERRTTFKKLDDGSKVKAPATVTRRATEYFLLALATAGTGDTERAKVWYTWGDFRLISSHTMGERRSSPMPGETSAEAERARAEPFRQEAARALGLRAEPITQADLRKLKHDPAHPTNRLAWMLGRGKAGEPTAVNDATAIWAAEFLLTHSEPLPELTYNAACIYSLASGRVPAKKQEYADRAVELVRRAVELGFKDIEHLKTDTDLDLLRHRDDFKPWLADLEKAAPRVPEVAPPPRPKG